MLFLVDASLSPRLTDLLAEYGHDAVHHDAILPARTRDAAVATAAISSQRCLLTRDYDFADVREFEPRRHSGIVVLAVPPDAGSAFISSLVREFLERLPDLGDLRGKLLIVEPGRIRVRE